MSGGEETIAAVATPPGRGGVGIIRISGPACAAVAEGLFGSLPDPRHAAFRQFRDKNGDLIDSGLALYFKAPHSFTGEDVLELQGHGGPVVMDLLLQRCLSLGVRPARAGEFTERAFLNEKIDLAQAEAVADLIEAGSEAAARAAQQSLQGAFSQQVHQLLETLIELRMYVESAIDFPEEEIDFLSDGVVVEHLQGVIAQLAEVQVAARQGCLLREGMTVVIAGRPNVGKSSLLNALAGVERAIVTDIAGTTRDVLREHIQIEGMPLHLIDTAGLREGAGVVEAEGIRRAWKEIEVADRLLLLIDDTEGLIEADEWIRSELPKGLSMTVVRNKIDLSGRQQGLTETEHGSELALSAKTGEGLSELREHLKACMGFQVAGEGGFTARRRHLEALERAAQALQSAHHQLEETAAGELVAEELHQAQKSLGEITGIFSSDDLLGRIFASFCIGK